MGFACKESGVRVPSSPPRKSRVVISDAERAKRLRYHATPGVYDDFTTLGALVTPRAPCHDRHSEGDRKCDSQGRRRDGPCDRRGARTARTSCAGRNDEAFRRSPRKPVGGRHQARATRFAELAPVEGQLSSALKAWRCAESTQMILNGNRIALRPRDFFETKRRSPKRSDVSRNRWICSSGIRSTSRWHGYRPDPHCAPTILTARSGNSIT